MENKIKNSMVFYWCSTCYRWHKDKIIGLRSHFNLEARAEEEPNKLNFDGTEEELMRFLIGYEIREKDKEDKIIEFERRIDERILLVKAQGFD